MIHDRPTSPVMLPSAGLRERRATRHEFVRFEDVDPASLKFSTDHGPRGLVGERRRALVYRCTETGAERRWGIE